MGVYSGFILACKGDTPAVAEMTGFKIGVGFANKVCRRCMISSTNLAAVFSEVEVTNRTLVLHQQWCDMVESTDGPTKILLSRKYGINKKSCLAQLTAYDIAMDHPFDIMHTLFEGYGHHILYQVLSALVADGRPLLVQHLNVLLRKFPYAHCDKKNIPADISLTLTGKFKQKAAQFRTLLKIMPELLYEVIDFDNRYYNYFLEFVEITQIVCSPVLSVGTSHHLTEIIEMHLKKFQTLFPDASFTPKMHFLVHIPKQILEFGPPTRWSCMREEAKHKWFKAQVRASNFLAVDKTLAHAHQKYDCAKFGGIGKRMNQILEIGVPKNNAHGDNVLQLLADERSYNRVPLDTDDIKKCKNIVVSGTKYISNKTVLVVGAQYDDPIFGKVEHILVINKKEVFMTFKLYTTLQYEPLRGGYLAQSTDQSVILRLDDALYHKPQTMKQLNDNCVLVIPDCYLFDCITYFHDK